MKLTVIVSDIEAAANVGGPVTYRRITIDLTPEQSRALTLHDKWESHGTTLIELDEADRVCTCGTGYAPHGKDGDGKCYRCGKRAPGDAGERGTGRD
jgi:hypothetical protein